MSAERALHPRTLTFWSTRSRAVTERPTALGTIVRLAAAVALCVALLPLWRAAGLDAVYRGVVLGPAQVVAHLLGIIPESRRLAAAIFSRVSLEPVLLFVLSLGIVASRLGGAARLRRYGSLLVALAAVNVVCVLIEAAIAANRSSFVREGEALVVPLTFVILDRFRFVLFHIGLQLWPFAAMALTVHWNRETAPGRGA